MYSSLAFRPSLQSSTCRALSAATAMSPHADEVLEVAFETGLGALAKSWDLRQKSVVPSADAAIKDVVSPE